MSSTIISLLPPPPSLINMTSSSSSSSSFINDSSTSTTSTPPSPAAIDTLLGSLPLASLQLLKFCCAAVGRHLLHHHPHQTSGGDEGESGDDDGLKMVTSYSSSFSSSSSSSSSSPPSAVDCLWPTNPALLCDRFHLLHLAANLTASNPVEDYFSRSGGNGGNGIGNLDDFGGVSATAGDSSMLWSAGAFSSSSASQSSFSDFVQDDQTSSYLSPNIRIMLTILLTLMIISTVIGNILVCLSVILVRKLRHPSNYLLVSLAISDLCVAILVMPLALQYELNGGSWVLSNAVCDLWVSFDVTCCTSSILNLCTISIDRYLAITKPLTYGVRRTTRRILSFIAAVWIASCLISIPPVLLIGNEYGSAEAPTCEVSQNMWYQLYGTLGAFYIPLALMIFMYYKIYVAAKRVVEAELRDQRPSCSSATSQCVSLLKSCSHSGGGGGGGGCGSSSTAAIEAGPQQQQLMMNSTTNTSAAAMNHAAVPKDAESGSGGAGDNETSQSCPNHHNHNHNHHHHPLKAKKCKSSSSASRKSSSSSSTSKQHRSKDGSSSDKRVERMLNVIRRDRKESKKVAASAGDANGRNQRQNGSSTVCSSACCSCLGGGGSGASTKSSTSSLPVTEQPVTANNSLSVPGTTTTTKNCKGNDSNNNSSSSHSNSFLGGKEPILTRHHGGQAAHHHQQHLNHHLNHHHHQHHFNPHSRSQSVHIQHHRISGAKKSLSSERSSLATVNYKRRASNALRERKASFTLGIIMSAFTVCWLPFFILALLRPFSSSIVEIPRFVTSIALWLGYANSMLNPIIYVTFHQDFRRAFKYLLCLQCSTMGSRLRAEAYISQYGGSLGGGGGGGHLNNSTGNGASNGTNGTKGGGASKATLRANASWGQLDERIITHGGFGEREQPTANRDHHDNHHPHHPHPLFQGGQNRPRAQFQQQQQQPLFSSHAGDTSTTAEEDEEDGVEGRINGLPPLLPPETSFFPSQMTAAVKEYELQSLPPTTAAAFNVTGNNSGGGGIPVSLLVTTTFALTHTTTTTSARMPLPPPPSSAAAAEPVIAIADAELTSDLEQEPVTGEYLNHPNSIDTTEELKNGGGVGVVGVSIDYNTISIEIDPKSHQATITRNSLS